MVKAHIYYRISSNLKVYANFSNYSETEIETLVITTNKKQRRVILLSRFPERFIYGLISYLNEYIQFRKSIFRLTKSQKFDNCKLVRIFNSNSSSNACILNIIFINTFSYDLIIKKWYFVFVDLLCFLLILLL